MALQAVPYLSAEKTATIITRLLVQTADSIGNGLGEPVPTSITNCRAGSAYLCHPLARARKPVSIGLRRPSRAAPMIPSSPSRVSAAAGCRFPCRPRPVSAQEPPPGPAARPAPAAAGSKLPPFLKVDGMYSFDGNDEDLVKVTEISPETGWVRVETKGGESWVNVANLTTITPVSKEPPPRPNSAPRRTSSSITSRRSSRRSTTTPPRTTCHRRPRSNGRTSASSSGPRRPRMNPAART